MTGSTTAASTALDSPALTATSIHVAAGTNLPLSSLSRAKASAPLIMPVYGSTTGCRTYSIRPALSAARNTPSSRFCSLRTARRLVSQWRI